MVLKPLALGQQQPVEVRRGPDQPQSRSDEEGARHGPRDVPMLMQKTGALVPVDAASGSTSRACVSSPCSEPPLGILAPLPAVPPCDIVAA